MIKLMTFILYWFVIIPVGVMRRLFGIKDLDFRWRDGSPSYWDQKQKKTHEKVTSINEQLDLNDRHRVCPQMADYDQIGKKQEFLPYLMSFCQPNCEFKSVSTNRLGFRTTLDCDGIPVDPDKLHSLVSSSSIVIGGSTVFGVGATNDSHTIPNILNRITGSLWFNFGGRAFNSTQEMLLFVLHLPRRLDRIVVFSGVNNLLLSFFNNGASPIYGPFFSQSVFESAIKNPSAENIGLRPAAEQFIKELLHFATKKKNQLEDPSPPLLTSDFDDDYQNILTCFRRDLYVCKLLAEGSGSQFHFALQPFATWVEKTLSPEEKNIFPMLDNIQSSNWQVVLNNLSTLRDRYFDDIARICAEEDVPYYNLNLDSAFCCEEWLFVDRVHLTDRGYALAAEIIKREFNL